MFHEPYFSSLSLFSGAADVSLEEAKRKQKGYRRRIRNDNGHGLFVADSHSKRPRVHPLYRFCAVQNFLHGRNQCTNV